MASILIIDDDQSTRMVLRRTLEKAGYEIFEAHDGEVGFQLYTEKPTDLVITDILMPGKDGIDTIVDLKFDFPKIKIIAISSDNGWLEIVKNLNTDDTVITLSKPLDMNKLLKAVNKLLNS